ncbi:hypothetical protein LEP1GSC172_2207 [Leptospira noguchii]|uniref:Uncharacterized protein n=1 Tax=Leptospira noguchii TaxID=28182 RepID=M6W1F3_9LEPT|nr:hypothetical protein LEP1GSC172_2207 [Leptospira noguchii]
MVIYTRIKEQNDFGVKFLETFECFNLRNNSEKFKLQFFNFKTNFIYKKKGFYKTKDKDFRIYTKSLFGD